MFFLLAGCLINTELYERRKAELTDGDGDGYAMEDECDDQDEGVHPGAPESCDGVDQDCDGAIDEDATDVVAWFEDSDGDGHGDATTETFACEAPADFVAADDDCDDADPRAYPDAADEWYDGVDSNCDDADDNDADGDGDPWDEAGGTDCNDADASVYLDAPEGWHDLRDDNDCDGRVDDQVRERLSTADRSVAPPVAGGRFGSAVVLIPDADGDDLRDLAISAPEDAGAGAYGGAVYFARSEAISAASKLDLEAEGGRLVGAAGDLFGASLAAGATGTGTALYVGALGAGEGAGVLFAFDESTLSTLESPTDTSAASSRLTAPGGASYFGSNLVVTDLDGDGVDDLAVTSSAGLSIWLDPPTGDADGDSADEFLEFRPDGASHWFLLSNPGDADGDGLGDLGVTQGGSGDGEVGAALYAGATFGGAFPDAAFATFVGSPTFGETANSGSGERVVMALLWQASAYVDLGEGAYDPLVDADYQLFRTSDEEAFSSAVHTSLGIAGPGYLLGAPLSTNGVEQGECVFWPESEWQAGAWSADMQIGLLGAESGDRACYSLAIGDDYDADGERDVLIGAVLAEGGGDEGRVYVQFAP